jgi:hypothetical protein
VPAVSVAPMRREADASGPTHGDVFLDGTRVGTWMADRFARAASRPPVGATGVDPMVAPGWPGALQGQ